MIGIDVNRLLRTQQLRFVLLERAENRKLLFIVDRVIQLCVYRGFREEADWVEHSVVLKL